MIVRVALTGAVVLALLFGCTEVSAEQGMHVLWPDYREPVEKITKRHPEPEAQKIIRLTGDDKPVELSGFHSCAKFFSETVRPPFEARVPYCDDRWESGWVEASTRAEAEVTLEVLLDGKVWQTATLSNRRHLDHVQYTKSLSLRSPKVKNRTSRKAGG